MALFIEHDTALSDSIKTTYHRIGEFSFNVFTGKVLVTVFSFITKADADEGKAPYSQATYQLSTLDPVAYAQLYPVLQSVLENGILADVPEFAGASLVDPSIVVEPEPVLDLSVDTPEEVAAKAALDALVAAHALEVAALEAAETAAALAAEQAALDAENQAAAEAAALAEQEAEAHATATAQAAAEVAAAQAALDALVAADAEAKALIGGNG